MIEIGKRYTLVAPKGTITQVGMDAIRAFIYRQNLKSQDEWNVLNPDRESRFLPELPETWTWEWLVTGRGEYVGTFPKRVSKYFYKVHGLKCPESFLSEIGNIARRHTEDNLTYSFDFTDQLSWQRGEFADGSSCFWTSNDEARRVMQEHGVKAIRFYESAESDKGIGRAWLCEIGQSLYIIFNGYGYATLVIARAFSLFLNLSYKKVDLSNYDNTGGLIYINNDSGYIIGTADEIEGIRNYDLEFETYENFCESCGERLHEDDTYFSPSGYSYCRDCFYENYRDCDICYEAQDVDNTTYVESTGQDVCDSCLERNFSYCETCEDYYEHDRMHERSGQWYCEDCFNDLPPEPDENEETDNKE